MQSGSIQHQKISPPPSTKVAIIATRWYPEIVDLLVQGARSALLDSGISSQNIHVFRVPGSFELPQAVNALAKLGQYRAMIPLGCLIRGETSHFDWIAQTVFSGLDEVGRQTGIPISIGVLTVENMDQAKARAGGKFGNKGEEAAYAALELAALLSEVSHEQPNQGS